MRVWKATFDDPDMGIMVCWGATRRLAEAQAESLLGVVPGEPIGEIDVEPVDIPTDKGGLIEWLNLHFDREND